MNIKLTAENQLVPCVRATLKKPTQSIALIEFQLNPLLLGEKFKLAYIEKIPEKDRVAFYLRFENPEGQARLEIIPEDNQEKQFINGAYYVQNEHESGRYVDFSILLMPEAESFSDLGQVIFL